MSAVEQVVSIKMESGTRRLESVRFRSARELLERVVEPKTAEELLRQAIERSGELPSDPPLLFRFLREEVGAALGREVGGRIASVWLDVARTLLCETERRICVIDPDPAARAGLVRALIREEIEVSFDEGESDRPVIRRTEGGWKLDGSRSAPTASVALLVRSVCEELGFERK